ncbi:Superoxide dismutase [Mn], mitochondrial [Portunus trituberculatus]|uniref:superoxide dismutase n=1 Tax=Portunus trituberculatus TaxID=210409 RepID=A0A5B7EID8_PORTR|nr:Superoxide dismutase [Mn], mitochondrial [Portunus trituberculatus]
MHSLLIVEGAGEERGAHSLPPLKYDYSALEPHICTTIMQIHHTKHHQGYINNLKAAVEKFQVYVKDAEKRSAKEKKWAKLSDGSSEKRSCWQEPAFEAPWASRFVVVEPDLAAVKGSIGQLSAVLLPLASGSAFSRFADGRASVRLPPQVLPWPVDVGTDPGGTVVSQAAATGWSSFSEEVDEVFDDIPLGETGVKCTSGTSRPGPTPLVLPRYPLALEVRRIPWGISNPASAKLALPRSLLMAWLPQLGVSGLRLVGPLVPDALRQLCLLGFRPLLLLRDPPLSSTPVECPAYREGLDCHSALEAVVSEMLIEGAIEPVVNWAKSDLSPSQRKQFLGMVLDSQSLGLPVARLGQPVSGSCPTVSASQGSTSVPLEVFAGTSCIPSMVSARQAPADVGSAAFVLIRRVLVRVRELRAVCMTLVASLWPQGDWFPLLLELLMDSPLILPMWRSLLRQPHHPLFHGSPEKLHLHAWRLSSVSSDCELAEAEKANDIAAINALFPAMKFNGGGHLNHTIFWTNMAPEAGGEPTGDIAEAINKDFGSFQSFKEKFSGVSVAVKGSGWGWLGYCPKDDKLAIASCQNQDPLQLTHGEMSFNTLPCDTLLSVLLVLTGSKLLFWQVSKDWPQTRRRLTAASSCDPF